MRYPESLTSGFVQLGSFIALLKVGVLLSLFHSFLFKSDIKKNFNFSKKNLIQLEDPNKTLMRKSYINKSISVDQEEDLINKNNHI